MMGTIDFQNAPFAVVLDEEINLASLTVAFGVKADFGIGKK